MLLLLLVVLTCYNENEVAGYRPVVLIHGLMYDNVDYMIPLAYNIQKAHPGTEVHLLEILQDTESYLPFWYQLTVFLKKVEDIIDSSLDGIHIIGYSQGGILSRGIIENLKSKKIHTYITMAAFHLGIYPRKLGGTLKVVPEKNRFKIGSDVLTKTSVISAFRDPKDFDKPNREKSFLAAINNEFEHELNKQYKENMCHLNKFILLASPDDGLVKPWRSGLFEFANAKGEMVDMKSQEIYKKDLICLKTLDEQKKLLRFEIPGIAHDDWPANSQVAAKYVIPYLD